MPRLSTQLLDTMNGRPAAGVRVTLDRIEADGSRRRIDERVTNTDGSFASAFDRLYASRRVLDTNTVSWIKA